MQYLKIIKLIYLNIKNNIDLFISVWYNRYINSKGVNLKKWQTKNVNYY